MKVPACEKIAVRHINTPSSTILSTVRRLAIQAMRRQLNQAETPLVQKEEMRP